MLGGSLILLHHTVLWNWITKNQRTAQHWSFEFEPLRFRVGSLTNSLIFVENCGCRSKLKTGFIASQGVHSTLHATVTHWIYLSFFASPVMTKVAITTTFSSWSSSCGAPPQSLHNSTSQALTKMQSYESWKSCESNCDWLHWQLASIYLSIQQKYVFFKVLYKVPMYHKPLTTNI
jgi:hypothetical protein